MAPLDAFWCVAHRAAINPMVTTAAGESRASAESDQRPQSSSCEHKKRGGFPVHPVPPICVFPDPAAPPSLERAQFCVSMWYTKSSKAQFSKKVQLGTKTPEAPTLQRPLLSKTRLSTLPLKCRNKKQDDRHQACGYPLRSDRAKSDILWPSRRVLDNQTVLRLMTGFKGPGAAAWSVS